jgi:hypothetical protein
VLYTISGLEAETDEEDDVLNPVMEVVRYRVPGVRCDVCGTWASSQRLRDVKIPEGYGFGEIRFLSPTEWRGALADWSHALGVSEDRLAPGARLGPPRGQRTGVVKEDVVHPFPGSIWVQRRVRDAIEAAKLVGVRFERVILDDKPEESLLFELVPLGKASRPAELPQPTRCELCGRVSFTSALLPPWRLTVDPNSWDGSDFFLLDGNPNVVCASERARRLFETEGFSNVRFAPIG